MDKVDRMLLGFWVKAKRDGGLRHECLGEREAYRLRFALYGMKKKVKEREEEFSKVVVEAMRDIALRVEGREVVAFLRSEDSAYEGLEGLMLGEGEEASEDARESMERMRRMFVGDRGQDNGD